MPLWLIRVCASILAAIVLGYIASWLVRSGTLHAIVTKINPRHHERELERGLISAVRSGGGKIVVIGHSAFVDSVRRSCSLGGPSIGIVVNRASWRDYEVAAQYLSGTIQPSLLVFHARPHLWTNIRLAWRDQKVDLLPTPDRIVRPSLTHVRSVIDALREIARRPVILGPSASMVPSFLGVVHDNGQAGRVMTRIAASLAIVRQKSTAMFVLNPDEIPADALPETRDGILGAFDRPAGIDRIQLQTMDRFAEQFACDRNALRSIAAATRGPEVKPLAHQ